VRSRNLMQGSDVPDIALPLANGTVRQLSNSLASLYCLRSGHRVAPLANAICPCLKSCMPKLVARKTSSR